MKRRLAWVPAWLGLLGLWAAPAPAAPQTFNTALPVAEGEFVLREQLLWLEATGDPGPADRELRVFGTISVLGFGIDSKLAVFGMLPYLDKKLQLESPADGRVTRDTTGIADARALYRLPGRCTRPDFSRGDFFRDRAADGRGR